MLRRKVRVTAVAAAVTLSLVTAVTGHHADAAARVRAAATIAHPFPAHVTYKTGVMPSASQSARDAAVTKQYDSWKSKYLRSACGGYLVYATGDAPNKGTVSEAQGYGMNIVPLMAGYDTNAQAEFDGLWKVVQDHRDS